MKSSNKFDYGKFLIEYRDTSGSPLQFLRKKVMDVDQAIAEANKLKNNGYSDVTIRHNEKGYQK